MQRHTQHPTWRIKVKSFSVGIRWLGGTSLHTTRSIAQIIVGLCSMSRLMCIISVADLVACRLNLVVSAVAYRKVPPRL
jgi:hypothetical protein